MNNIDNYVLLLFCHLIVAWQAKASVKDICTYIDDSGFFYVRVAAGSAGSVSCDERMHTIDRLHMHGLPDRASLCVEVLQGFKNLGRAGFAGFADVERIFFASNLLAHRVLVDDRAAEPVVRLTSVDDRHHRHRKIFESFFVSFVNCLLLCDVFFKVIEVSKC